MSNKQSSVDILCQKLAMKLGGLQAITFYIDHQEEIAQAKAMHKEELKKCAETFEVCYYDGIHNGTTFNEYYNETYGGNNEQ